MKKTIFFLSLITMQSVHASDCIVHKVQGCGVEVSVYNCEKRGFVVTAADRVIGYCDEGTFDRQTAPPALLAWMEAVAQQGLTEEVAPAAGPFSFEPVAPLLGTIAWNQDSPYNDLCPQFDFSSLCATGCVATAMAQVMYYHRWPEQGSGSHTYKPSIMRGSELTADFGSTCYQWDAMLPTYDAASSPESRYAVAELMLHCGVSVDMEYMASSGAMDSDVPPALITYFGYSHSLAYRKREHYGTADWLGVIHDELVAGRPVLAYGRSTSGGHAYVFDGMDQNGLIHVNWGWGGMCNGYYQTSALTPATQGIGGSDGGFNYSQRIITGISPLRDGMTDGDYAVSLTSTEGLSAGRKKVNVGSEVSIRLRGKIRNQGWRASTFDYGLQLVDAQGAELVVIQGPEGVTLDVGEDAYAPSFGNVTLGELAEGDYVLYPVCRDSEGTGAWQRIRDLYIGYPNYLRITVSGGSMSFTEPTNFELSATIDELPEAFYAGVPALVRATVSNTSDVEYHGEIRLVLKNVAAPDVVGSSSNHIIDLLPGQQCSIEFTEAYALPIGDYTLHLIDDDGQDIYPVTSVSLIESIVGHPYSAQPLSIVLGDDGQLHATAVISSDRGIFGGLLYTYIYYAHTKTLKSCLTPTYLLADDGQTTVTMHGTMENAEPGTAYTAQLVAYDGFNSFFLDEDASSVTFVYGEDNAIERIEADDADLPRFDLWGRPLQTVAPGQLFVTQKQHHTQKQLYK